jgi:heterodisulfide reductase subunit A-like polyferredoxin
MDTGYQPLGPYQHKRICISCPHEAIQEAYAHTAMVTGTVRCCGTPACMQQAQRLAMSIARWDGTTPPPGG